MTKEEVLAISGLTAAQREAAERWFAVPFNKDKEFNGTTAAEVKKKLNEKIAAHDKLQAAKTKKAEEFGTLDEVTTLVKSLCKGTRQAKPMFSYKDILNIINTATEEKVTTANTITQQFAELKAKAEELGIKLK